MKKYQQSKIFPGSRQSLTSIKKQIDGLAVDPATKLGMRAGLGSLGLSLIILGLMFTKLPPEIPLWFSRPYGPERLAANWTLALLPLISLVVQVISMRGAGAVIEEDKLMAQILIWAGTIVAIMNLIAVVKIVMLVV